VVVTEQATESGAVEQHLIAGVYEHYKGQRYLLLGTAHDSNHDGRVAVIYVPLYDAPGPRLAVRDLDDWLAWVHEDGSRCHVWTCEITQAMSRREVGMKHYSETHRPRFRLVTRPGESS
jgi:hypothetical protein